MEHHELQRLIAAAALSALLASPALAQTSTSLGITIGPAGPAQSITLNPPSPVTVPCNAVAGTVVTQVTTAVPATLTLTGQNVTDFVLSATNSPASVVVKTGGITPANCGKTFADTITSNP